MENKGFTIIELLVVVSIIGVLASIVLSSLSEARTRANIVSIQSTLRGFQTQAIIYQLDNDTFTGLCTYSDNTVHESVQMLIDKLKSTAGEDRVRCIVRTSDVGLTNSIHFQEGDQLEQKNFGLAVYYDNKFYAVDVQGVMTLDTANTGGSVTWPVASQLCADLGKRLPPIEVLKAVRHTAGGTAGFSTVHFSSTLSNYSSIYVYRMNMAGNYIRGTRNGAGGGSVRCAS